MTLGTPVLLAYLAASGRNTGLLGGHLLSGGRFSASVVVN
jgi:hypothetical protein